MRTAGMIIGGLFLLDGLTALCCGKSAVSWANRRLGNRLPGGVRRFMRETEEVDNRIITTWGINNTIAGASIMLASMLLPCTCEREQEAPEEKAEAGIEEEVACCC